MLIQKRYRLIRSLGEGGMGQVYLAQDLLKGGKDLVALKVLPHRQTTTLESFKQEFTLLTRLLHPNLARVFDFGFDRQRNQFYFTSEFVQGKNLFEATRRMAQEDIFSLFLQLSEVVAYLHEQNILHNDLKPANILVSQDGIKVLDFGVSSIFVAGRVEKERVIQGTPGYLAPEVLRGEGNTIASDLFSLGVVFLEILVGRHPYRGVGETTMLMRMANETLPDVREFRQDLPLSLTKLIRQMTDRFPRKRPRQAKDMVRVLAHLLPRRSSTSDPILKREIRAASFVNRQREISEIQLGLERLTPGTLFHLKGEKGVGKSRLIQRCAVEVQLRQIPIIVESCGLPWESAYHPWGGVYRQMEGFVDFDSTPAHALVQRVFFRDDVSSPPEGFGAELRLDERIRLFDAFGTICREFCQKTKACFVLDDVEIAPADARALLEFLLRLKIPGFRLLASTPTAMDENLREFFSQFTKETLLLDPFGQEEVKALILSCLGTSVSSPFLQGTMANLSAGNPGKVVEVLENWRRNGWLRYRNRSWHLRKQVSRKHLRGGDLHRIKRFHLQKRDLEVLSPCLIFPEAFGFAELAALQNKSTTSMRLILERFVQDGILKRAGFWRYAWKDMEVRRHLENKLKARADAQERIHSWQKAVGEFLARDPSSSMEDLYRARLFFRECHAQREFARLSMQLGKTAVARCAFDLAESLLAPAYEVRQELSSDERLEMQRLMAELYTLRGDIQKAQNLFQEILQTSMDTATRALIAREMMVLYRQQARYKEGITLGKEILPALSQDTHTLICGRVHAQLALLYAYENRKEECFAHLQEGFSRIGLQEHPREYAQLRNISGTIRMRWPEEAKGAPEDFERALTLFQKQEDLLGQATVLYNLAQWHSQQGSLDRALTNFERGIEMANACGDVRRAAFYRNGMGALLLQQGQLQSAKHQFQEALDVSRLLGQRNLELNALFNLAHTLHWLEDYKEAIRYFTLAFSMEEVQKGPKQFQGKEIGLAGVYLSMGDLLKVEEILNNAALRQPSPPIRGSILLLKGEMCRERGGYAEAHRFLGEARDIFTAQDLHREAQEAQALLIRNKMHSPEGVDTGDLTNLKHVLEHLRSSESVLQRLSYELDLLELKIKLDPTAKSLAEAAQQLEEEWKKWEIVPGEYRMHLDLLWAEITRIQGDLERSLSYLQRAQAHAEKVAQNLPSEHRTLFLKTSRVQLVRRALERFKREASTFWKAREINREHLDRLRSEISNWVEIFHISPRGESWIDTLLDRVAKIVGAREMVLLSWEKRHLKMVGTRLPKEKKRRSGKWQVKDQLACEKALVTRKPIHVRGFHITPLRNPATKIEGLLAVDATGGEGAQEILPSDLLPLLEAVLVQGLRLYALEARVKRGESDLSLLRRTLFDQERTLKFVRGFSQWVGGRSPAITKVMDQVQRLQDVRVPLLIVGETGTGKSLLARLVHEQGHAGAFVEVNCAAMRAVNLEDYLFGHVHGAFTGADADYTGVLVQADQGTLVLDQVDEMPLPLQAKLLRVLQEKEVLPLGGTQPQKIDFRLIALSRKNLQELVREKRFREDLFYRLHVVVIEIPPLRARREDIPLLLDHFMVQEVKKGRERKTFEGSALKRLWNFPWPGNVRQLENLVQKIMVTSSKERLHARDLERELPGDVGPHPPHSLRAALKGFSATYFENLLMVAQSNLSLAARLARVTRKTLYRYLKENQLLH